MRVLLEILAAGAILYIFGLVVSMVIIFSYDVFSEERRSKEDERGNENEADEP